MTWSPQGPPPPAFPVLPNCHTSVHSRAPPERPLSVPMFKAQLKHHHLPRAIPELPQSPLSPFLHSWSTSYLKNTYIYMCVCVCVYMYFFGLHGFLVTARGIFCCRVWSSVAARACPCGFSCPRHVRS